MGDQYNFSGQFNNAIFNINSTLTNVQQTIGEIKSDDQGGKEELIKLIGQLNESLQKAPLEKSEQAEAVAQSAEALVAQAKAEKPNKTMLQITGEGLKQAAQNLADVMPSVIPIAAQIVLAIGRLTAG